MSEDHDFGWGVALGGVLGFGLFCAVVVVAIIATESDVSKKYQECIALGAPAENCLKEYVLPDNQKGE